MSAPDEEMRFKEISLTVPQQTIIELGYAVRMIVGPLAKSHQKLSFDEANCLRSVFCQVREMLKKVDPEYLDRHSDVVNFYKQERELSNNWDRLAWVPAGEPVLSEFDILGAHFEKDQL